MLSELHVLNLLFQDRFFLNYLPPHRLILEFMDSKSKVSWC